MKNNWWKVPLYCMVSGWVCYWLEILWLGKWAIVVLPDGTITSNNTRWMIMSAAVFVVVVSVGGLVFFRRMTRREIAASATVLAAVNVTLGLLSMNSYGALAIFFVESIEWSSIVAQLIGRIDPWAGAVISWVASPYIFVLFGKKENQTAQECENNADQSLC